MEQHTKELYERLQTLTLLRPLLREPLLQSFSAMMESMLSLADGNKLRCLPQFQHIVTLHLKSIVVMLKMKEKFR